MPTIEIADDTYESLKRFAQPFETPNDVIQKIIRKFGEYNSDPIELLDDGKSEKYVKTDSAKNLAKKYGIEVAQKYFHKDSRFYNPFKEKSNLFPAALMDSDGYVIFETMESYLDCPYIKIGKRLNVPEGIYNLPRYIKYKKEA